MSRYPDLVFKAFILDGIYVAKMGTLSRSALSYLEESLMMVLMGMDEEYLA